MFCMFHRKSFHMLRPAAWLTLRKPYLMPLWLVADVYYLVEGGLTTYFIGNDDYFNRDTFYGYDDDGERFGFFCKATLEMLMFLDLKPDIIHLNDWQTALIGLLLKEEYSKLDFYNKIKIIFTIHNLQYQGVFERDTLDALNLSPRYFKVEAIEYYGKICFMKAGIVYGDLVTTVSKTYANEIQTPWFGYGLDGILRKYSYKIRGIVNGIYYDKYDPETDPALLLNFGASNFRTKRLEHKKLVQEKVNLPQKNVPLFGVVTRLAEQKGIDLIIYAMEQLLHEDVQFMILGSGDKYYEKRLKELMEEYPDKVNVTIQFDQKHARQIYGACDFFLMPSLFEPCGLSQLYSLRYGAVPIVRKTGGLVDTIVDYTDNPEEGTGFIFKNYNGQDFELSIRRAISYFYNKDTWELLVERGMNKRFSWENSASHYIESYNDLMQ
ncbi:MAG: starch synthase [Firmicutes bacterium HGW-Firmicutes-5]|nr:MAG: starch synthase [Firmicutes bacterium HGW-Firmicutes-5]